LGNAFRDIHARDEEIRQLKDTLAQREATIEEKNKTINEHEAARRKLHNTIQELKVGGCSLADCLYVETLLFWVKICYS